MLVIWLMGISFDFSFDFFCAERSHVVCGLSVFLWGGVMG